MTCRSTHKSPRQPTRAEATDHLNQAVLDTGEKVGSRARPRLCDCLQDKSLRMEAKGIPAGLLWLPLQHFLGDSAKKRCGL